MPTPGVAHRVDADGVVALLLRADADLGEGDLGQADVVARVEQRRAGADAPEVELDVGPELDLLELGSSVGDAGLPERERDDDEDTGHQDTSTVSSDARRCAWSRSSSPAAQPTLKIMCSAPASA